jgi:DNA (cytosine-5)-methyltransferase 1
MKFGSVCSGIEAASVAWTPLGWQAAWLSEIEKFPCEVLKHHYPDVPNLGDMTKLPNMILSGQVEAPDLFCGGTPCQAFSVAGLRQSLDDARGNLSLTFCEIANAIDQVRSVQQSDPCIVFWENVPGVLNTKDNAFGCFLGALAGEDDALIAPGGRWTNAGFIDGPQRAVAWRVLDAQYFGVAQRRRRVFVVASARDDFDPAAVLFEFDGVRRDIAPSREAGERVAPCVTNGPPFSRTGNERVEAGPQGKEYLLDGSAYCMDGRGQPQAIAFEPGKLKRLGYGDAEPGLSPKLRSEAGDNQVAVASFKYTMGAKAHGIGYAEEQSPTLDTKADSNAVLTSSMAVRRLTLTECERLQGFPDGYTNIKDKCPDGPRYKALGNSWAVPVVRWIGERINRALA